MAEPRGRAADSRAPSPRAELGFKRECSTVAVSDFQCFGARIDHRTTQRAVNELGGQMRHGDWVALYMGSAFDASVLCVRFLYVWRYFSRQQAADKKRVRWSVVVRATRIQGPEVGVMEVRRGPSPCLPRNLVVAPVKTIGFQVTTGVRPKLVLPRRGRTVSSPTQT